MLTPKYVPFERVNPKRLGVGAGREKDKNKPPKPSPDLYFWVGLEHLSLQASYDLVQQSWLFSSSQTGICYPHFQWGKGAGGGKKPHKTTGSDPSSGCAVEPHTSCSEGCEQSTAGAKSAGIDTGGDLRTLDWAGHIPSTTGQLSPTDTCTHRARRRKERCRYWRGGGRRQSVPLSISKARQTLGTNHGNCTRI